MIFIVNFKSSQVFGREGNAIPVSLSPVVHVQKDGIELEAVQNMICAASIQVL